MRSSSVTGSGMASPDLMAHEPMGGYSHDNNQPHDLQYPDNMMIFSQMPSGQQPFDQQTLAMMGTSMAMNQPQQQQQQQQQQKQRMGMMGLNQFQQSPIIGGGPGSGGGEGVGVHMNQNFGQEQYHDTGLDELLASTMHSHPGQGPTGRDGNFA